MHQRRKSEHIRINLEEDVGASCVSTGFERYRLLHKALPEVDLAAIDTSVELLGKRLVAPVIVSSMTGGTPEARTINHRLAEAAQQAGIGMGLGSQRAAIEDPSLEETYRVRHVAPGILLLANLGAVQLNYGYGLDECYRAVEMIEADALVLHVNPLQEALQPEGNARFADLLPKIETVCQRLDVPVMVKEVGWGISEQVARQLADAGVAAIDVAGAGGSSWSKVEMHRAVTHHQRAVAAAFSDWGIPTAESLRMVRRGAPDVDAVASGGIRDGIQIAKAVALGAVACGLAGPFLQAANESTAAVADLILTLVDQLRVAMFASGSRDIAVLRQVPVLHELGAGWQVTEPSTEVAP
jgi:isopentenyl-diphosphate delta-isomerase